MGEINEKYYKELKEISDNIELSDKVAFTDGLRFAIGHLCRNYAFVNENEKQLLKTLSDLLLIEENKLLINNNNIIKVS